MTADVIYLHRPQPLPLSTRARVMIIESLAHKEHVTDAAKAIALRRICHPSLHGLRLWLAWRDAEDAILVRDRPGPKDCDHEGDVERAEAAVLTLLHGNRNGGSAA